MQRKQIYHLTCNVPHPLYHIPPHDDWNIDIIAPSPNGTYGFSTYISSLLECAGRFLCSAASCLTNQMGSVRLHRHDM